MDIWTVVPWGIEGVVEDGVPSSSSSEQPLEATRQNSRKARNQGYGFRVPERMEISSLKFCRC
jgi:hypothetical protein